MQKTIPNKIGLGLITCDRPEFFEKSFGSVKENYDISFLVVDDGEESVRDLINWGEDCNAHYIKTTGRTGVGAAKNKALKYLVECGCEHLFLMEDDIIVKDQAVFDAYINTSKAFGIKHLNFALHGNHNINHLGRPNIRKTIDLGTGQKISLYPNVLGAFSYYHISTIETCGYMDENFYNAMEHVDHTYQIIKAGMHPPFRWFADIHNSTDYLQDIVGEHKNSKIRSQEDFIKTFMTAVDYFIKKNGFSVVPNYGPPEQVTSYKETLQILRDIYDRTR